MRHVTVYARRGLFAGWPANNGVWSWDGRELLVGYTVGAFAEQRGHNILEPYRSLLARSTDMGETWTPEEPTLFVGADAPAHPCPAPLDLSAPGLALRIEGTGYHGSDDPAGALWLSLDRGRGWQGPFTLAPAGGWPELGGLEITARTDYVVEGPRSCLVMISARTGAFLTDRACCIRTTDGGRSFQFVGWVVPPSDPHRAVMPSTVRGADGALVTAARRREAGTQRCWIDVYRSSDGGRTWALAGKVGDTGAGNGNPPALARLADGRLCCVYGERDTCRMLARYSADEGATWSEVLLLRDDFHRDVYGDADMGYPRLVLRDDGQLLAIYYWATHALPQQHIAATIWEP
ncbi:MAG: exo-alpha-sialidase [Chloroflexi bacterium]|nr:exo-alpha-sialidase [Chloroflexota bacterium]